MVNLDGRVLVAGTFDTKGPELLFLRERLAAHGLVVQTVDLSTSGAASDADVRPEDVLGAKPSAGDRGAAVTSMAEAFAAWIDRQSGIAGIISAGGSGNTTLATAGMRRLPVGVPKVMISTLASGDVGPYVGSSDIFMLYAVADIQGLNRITERILANGADALAGMAKAPPLAARAAALTAIGATMFGVTTPLVQAVQKALAARYDVLVFHATGTGGRAMERLGDSGLLAGFLDLTTTEVADMLCGGILAADEDRFGAAIRSKLPFVGSVGALDMVNFGPRATVPARFEGRKFHVHNANVTLMRTTPEDNRRIGEWIGGRLNAMEGEVRFLLPLRGVSIIDAPGMPFHDPVADAALFDTLKSTVKQSPRRRLIDVDANINDETFIAATLAAFTEIMETH